MRRIVTVTQARSQYLKTLAAAETSNTSEERRQAQQEVKDAARVLQSAQMQQRLKVKRGPVSRPSDWNAETW